MTALIIDLEQLPEEGRTLTGELNNELFDLPKGDATPLSPLFYELFVQQFHSELFIQGSIHSTFCFTCVRTLHDFSQTISVPKLALSLEITQPTIDLSETLREEILLQFPAHPNCSQGDAPSSCEIKEDYLAVDKSEISSIEPSSPNQVDPRWDALDGLQDPLSS